MNELTVTDWVHLAIQGFIALAAVLGGIQSMANRSAIREVHLTLNGRLDELLRSTKALGHLEGAESERANPKPMDDKVKGNL